MLEVKNLTFKVKENGMVRISALMILTIGQMRESAMHFSSRPGLKE